VLAKDVEWNHAGEVSAQPTRELQTWKDFGRVHLSAGNSQLPYFRSSCILTTEGNGIFDSDKSRAGLPDLVGVGFGEPRREGFTRCIPANLWHTCGR
jgi:hypothetical protein